MSSDRLELAQSIVDANRYLTLGTADESGTPWVSPVWYAPVGLRELFWVSVPEARHSRNIARRPEVAIVVFDSTVPAGEAQAVYASALAAAVPDDDLERGIDVFARRSVAQGAPAWTRADVASSARLRLYRAIVSELFVLGARDERLRVELG